MPRHLPILLLFSLLLSGCSVLPKKVDPAQRPTKSPVPTAAAVTMGIAATGGGVAACLAGAPAIGIPVAGAGVTVLILGLTVAKFGAWIAGLGAVLLLAAVVVFLASRLRRYRAGFADVVATVQTAKGTLVEAAREQFSKVLDNQDDATKQLVKDTKIKEHIE